jgi:hypothetical protein
MPEFGWGARFPHPTGRYHKRGHQNGALQQSIGTVDVDIAVPDIDLTLGQLWRAQALGDVQMLAAHGRPALRLPLRERPTGLVALMRAVQELG